MSTTVVLRSTIIDDRNRRLCDWKCDPPAGLTPDTIRTLLIDEVGVGADRITVRQGEYRQEVIADIGEIAAGESPGWIEKVRNAIFGHL